MGRTITVRYDFNRYRRANRMHIPREGGVEMRQVCPRCGRDVEAADTLASEPWGAGGWRYLVRCTCGEISVISYN